MAAPWADVLYAMDRNWWQKYIEQAKADFKGLRFSPLTGNAGVKHIKFKHYQNSGLGAISLALHWGASRVILLGYDCQKTGGKAHWHGDHPKGLGNAGSIATWPNQFTLANKDFKRLNANIINCSKETALTMFDRRPLDEVLHEHD